jgi:pyridoxine 5'-phosphate synthase PdxJ
VTTENAPAAQPQGADDEAARARHARMQHLIRVNAILKHRKDALTLLLDENEKQLELLMNDARQRVLVGGEGTAKFTSDRCFDVISVEALMKTFTKEQLATGFKPSATFVDAAIKAGIKVRNAIVIGTKPGFEVRRSQSMKAREEQERIVEETRRQLAETVDKLAEQLRNSTAD